MSLRISLRDGEKCVVNGAVLRSEGRTNLYVENGAAILRGRDVMSPADADTAAKCLYLACMMAYIDPAHVARHQETILAGLGDLITALGSAEARSVCIAFAEKVAALDFYSALADCRWLIAYEATALARLSETVQ
ncbi:flagellar biosynthesis repressor FlbT [Sphingobium boeckii]|uniref:Flagellar protein FlbT n=1 Tax=Sphingobium boeckii TaxID=1082345 RepID=A0A7W9EDT0_9SPHN|nr:flagellar biosynthesis repressor FlbT [Sphingobium boeckii]MBB5685249.1 flagellar protein FlbT [Sphingobium boeckii]